MYSWTSTLGERMLAKWCELRLVMHYSDDGTTFNTRLQPDMVGLVPIKKKKLVWTFSG